VRRIVAGTRRGGDPPSPEDIGPGHEDEPGGNQGKPGKRPELDPLPEGEEATDGGDRGRDLAHVIQADGTDASEEGEVDEETERGRRNRKVQERCDAPRVE